MSVFRPEIEEMEGYTPGFQPPEGEYIKLNTNENPYPPSPSALEAMR
ncbi:MAG: histidinol-phosphate transaminase, partial [Planctomycetota bacterium]